MAIINDDSSVVSEQSFWLIVNARGVIYDRHMFIIQATDFPNVSNREKSFYDIESVINVTKLFSLITDAVAK